MSDGGTADPDVTVVEVVPGEYDVTPSTTDAPVRVLVPPGVGLPGVSDEELAGALIAELVARGEQPSGTLDVAQMLRSDPGLLHAVDARVDDGE